MKIKNTSQLPPAANDDTTDISTPKSDELNKQVLHPPAPEDSAKINRLNNPQSIEPHEHDIETRLSPPIDLAHYAATGSLHALQDKLFMLAEQILLTTPREPVTEVRNQVIDLVLKENFRTLLTGQEQNDIADTLKRALVNDPIFCSEVDNMLEIAARKLEIDNQS